MYLGATLTDQNCTREEIKSRLSVGNACCSSVQSFLSSLLVVRNMKVEVYKSIVLTYVLYGCETWFLTLGDEHRLRVFQNKVLRRIFEPKGDEVL
jgi:hypothetical protein